MSSPEPPEESLQAAHASSMRNERAVSCSHTLACFYCLATFASAEVVEWCTERDGLRTALCPRCGIDSVLCSASGVPMDQLFLEAMQRRYFHRRANSDESGARERFGIGMPGSPIPVKSYGFRRTYPSLEEAVAGANSLPGKEEARSATAELEGRTLGSAWFTEQEALLVMSGQRWLYLFLEGDDVHWRVCNAQPASRLPGGWRPGRRHSFYWGDTVGVEYCDFRALLACRAGSVLSLIDVLDTGVLVYFRGHEILWFQRIRRLDTGQDMIKVGELN